MGDAQLLCTTWEHVPEEVQTAGPTGSNLTTKPSDYYRMTLTSDAHSGLAVHCASTISTRASPALPARAVRPRSRVATKTAPALVLARALHRRQVCEAPSRGEAPWRHPASHRECAAAAGARRLCGQSRLRRAPCCVQRGQLAARLDHDVEARLAGSGSARLHRAHDVHALDDLSKDGVFTVEPRRRLCAYEELASVCVRPSVRHG